MLRFPARIGVDGGVDELGFQATQRFGHRGGPFSSSGSKSIRGRVCRVPLVDNPLLWAVLARKAFSMRNALP